MDSGVHRQGALATRSVSVLAMVMVCALIPLGCGSGAHASSATSTSGSGGGATSGTQTSSTTPAASQTSVTGRVHLLPHAAAATGLLPAQPPSTTTSAEHAYLTSVFRDAQQFWQQEFRRAHLPYRPARLHLYEKAVHSACGTQTDTGPFYCPGDRTVYLDLVFLEEVVHHAGVGPFGQAFIVGHELGHHVQNRLAIDHYVATLNERDKSGANARSVRVELQADCLAGVWAYSSQARGQLTDTDLDDALKTAQVIGDDYLQHNSGQAIDSSLWTHGSSEQRQRWLAAGFRSGRPGDCDTFASGLAQLP